MPPPPPSSSAITYRVYNVSFHNIPVTQTSSTHRLEAVSAKETIRLALDIVIAYAQPDTKSGKVSCSNSTLLNDHFEFRLRTFIFECSQPPIVSRLFPLFSIIFGISTAMSSSILIIVAFLGHLNNSDNYLSQFTVCTMVAFGVFCPKSI